MHTVTIVARNYLPRARVLARTYARHNPGDSFSILVVDAEPGELPDGVDHEIVVPRDLPLSHDEFDRMALIYDVTELCTALKPWALELLLDRGAEVATYLDPDIAVYESLQLIEKLSLDHGIVLTPHTVDPIPRDGLSPTEADIMQAGVYNLGFLAVNQGSRPMLTWWEERLLRDCVIAPSEMLFVDQRWIDLVPGYFEHTVLNDRAYNVAYWNLDSRPLVRTDSGEVEVEGTGPLRFFHFSGYEPARPWVLSKYHVERPRVVLSEHPVVQELCDEYAEWITHPSVGGSPGSATSPVPYRFDRLASGMRVTKAMRRAVRHALIASDEEGAVRPPGWSDEQELVDWFLAPAEEGSTTNRYLHAFWQSRPDVQAVFTAPLRAHSELYVGWAWDAALRDSSIVTDLLPRPESYPVSRPDLDVDGVNLAGYFTAEMGVGEIGRMLVDGVKAAGLPYSVAVNRHTLSRQNVGFDDSGDRTCYGVTVAAVNADQLPHWARDCDPGLIEGHTIGMWAWEVEEFPPFTEALDIVDEVWTISAFARDAIAAATTKPVHVIPLPMREPYEAERLDRAALGIPEGPYFLFAFDYLSVFERKNPLGLVQAFRDAFPDADGPALVLKSMNGHRCRTDRERLRLATADRPDIVLIEESLDAGQMGGLMAECTAYVSLHRAEGYGLTLSEAMTRGRPVVATGYSGNLDFMDGDNSLLVPYELVGVAPGSGPYPSTTHWADPDLAVATGHLRWIVEHPEEAEALGRRGAESIRVTGDMQHIATFVRTRVEEALMGLRQEPTPEIPATPERPVAETSRADEAIAKARSLVDERPSEPSEAEQGGLGRPLRRAVARAFGSYDRHQQERLTAMLSATSVVSRRADRALKLARGTREDLRAISGSVSGTGLQVGELRAELETRTTQLAQLREQLATLQDAVAGGDQSLRSLVEHVQQIVRDASSSLTHLEQVTAQINTELVARPFTADGSLFLEYDDPARVPPFDDLFRGSEEQILDRMQPYLGLLRDAGPVLEIGCGRGELLRVLGDAGVEARGVDLDERAVRRAVAHGVDAIAGDGLAVLDAEEPGSLGAVVAIEVVEHLSVDEIRPLFEAAHRALRPGGLLVLETVNPHSPPALKAFWLDLTHVRPLYPESLVIMAGETGFSTARTVFPQGGDDVEANLRGCGEFAVVATR